MIPVRPASLALLSLVFLGCTPDDEVLTQGFIKLEFLRGESQTGDPYIGTSRVVISMDYQTCLRDYYTANPDQQQDGREGELIFGSGDLGGEGWADRICDKTVPAQADCTVARIQQELDMGVPHLTVEYNFTGDKLENRILLFGPLPNSETAACPDPEVRVSSSLPSGYNGAGAQVWVAENITPTKALTGQGGAIKIKSRLTSE